MSNRGARGVMVIVAGIGHEFKSWTDCISHSTNRKGMNLPHLCVNSRADKEKENSEFKPIKLLCHILPERSKYDKCQTVLFDP